MAAVTNFFSSLFKPSAAAPALPANRRNVEVATGNFAVNATAPHVAVNNRNAELARTVPGPVAVGGKRSTRKSKAQRRASRKNNRRN